MPLIRSAKKRLRQDQKKRTRNQALRSRARNQVKKIRRVITEGNLEEAQQLQPGIMRLLDKTAAKGVWHKNKVARLKSRLSRQLAAR